MPSLKVTQSDGAVVAVTIAILEGAHLLIVAVACSGIQVDGPELLLAQR